MKYFKMTLLILLFLITKHAQSQDIWDFTSITPTVQTNKFIIASSHTFQKIMEVDDALTAGGTFPRNPDFTGYVSIANSSVNGYLSINSEAVPGGNTILDIMYDTSSKLWTTNTSEAIDFTPVVWTAANCSGTVTSWGTVISSEEVAYNEEGSGLTDTNLDGYNDLGWNIEIDPVSKSIVNGEKLWAMGNFKHENVTIHTNERTVYQGADSNPGYLYKFVATNPRDLSAGDLYVYTGSKNGSGNWVLINDSTIAAHQEPDHRNKTFEKSTAAEATAFAGIEDVEIGPDGMVYFAVKGAPDRRIYRFQDSNPLTGTTVTTMETFVGNTDANQNISYDINDGTTTTSVAWGSGNDNLAFDGDGNLWVLQDGGNHYIWVVKNGHTQASPDVAIFGITPTGSEPTGITFTPDNKFLFMSIQHPDAGNVAAQTDAAGNTINFNKGTALVIALNSNLGSSFSTESRYSERFGLFPNPLKPSKLLNIKSKSIINVKVVSILGKTLYDQNFSNLPEVEIDLKSFSSGVYIVKLNHAISKKLIIN